MRKAVIIAGEKSGDLIGAEVCNELIKNGFTIYGIGGSSMLQNGLKESFFHISEISLMGFLEVLPSIFKIKKRINETAERILKIDPDFVLTIDSPGFCTRVVKKIKGKFKGKIYHAVAPTVWAYREGRAKTFAKLYDTLFCILPFEPPYFERVGLRAKFICYPPLLRLKESILQAKEHQKKHILVFLGSRRGEVIRHLPLIKEVYAKIKAKIPNAKFAFPSFKEFEKVLKEAFPRERVETEDRAKMELLKGAKLAICKSGTGAVEASLFEIPTMVFYKVHFISFLIIKALAKIKFVNIINILLQREVIPEFLQFNATAENISRKALEFLENEEICSMQIKEVLKAKDILSAREFESFGCGVVKSIMLNL